MKFATSAAILLATTIAVFAEPSSFENILRKQAVQNGLVPTDQLQKKVPKELVSVGRALFESEAVSLNGDLSCQTCHLDEFGSADGLPNAIGVGGQGEGPARGLSGGGIIPRNTLPFWGRGARGFDVLFWDGKVDFKDGRRLSQFGDAFPSSDPLVTAVHLPPVEIREMLIEDQFVGENKQEEVNSAAQIYEMIVMRLREQEPKSIASLARFYGVEEASISFLHVAEAIAGFIREKFKLRSTKFHEFVFENGSLSADELAGGLIFYGKGKCATCHSGPFLTDMDFHAIPFPQIGFGKNGFGVDYGRYNVTHDPKDLYRFRTPPLFNVLSTGPYGHSGSIRELETAIIYHFDPLRFEEKNEMKLLDRVEYYKRLAVSAEDLLSISPLDDEEVNALVSFLETLSFESKD